MGLKMTKVQPATDGKEISDGGKFAVFYRRMKELWYQSHIGHRSEYSVERLLAFRDYCQRTSFTRVAAVCILTPFPAIFAALLIDCTPLKPPSDGWQANYGFWIRWFLALVAVSVGSVAQVQEGVPVGTISNTGAVIIVMGTALLAVLVAIAIAAMWRFPIPFGYIIMVGPYMLAFFGLAFLVIGPRHLFESPVLRRQLMARATIVVAQGSVAMAYPLFTAVFYHLSGPEQTAFVIVLPVFKLITKHIIANAAGGLHEYVGPVVVFSIDVFSVFYVAMCMQISKSLITTLFIIASDSFHVIIAIRDIFHQVDIVESTRDTGQSKTCSYIEDLLQVVSNVFRKSDHLTRTSRLRVLAPFPLALTNESHSFINTISRENGHDFNSSRAHTLGPSTIATHQVTEVKPIAVDENNSKLNHVSSAHLTTNHSYEPVKLSRKGSSPRRLLTFMDSDVTASADKLRSTLSHSAMEDAAWDALQALFHSEYLLMAEYIECTLPLYYAVYLFILYHLPVAAFYPQTASSTPQKLSQNVINNMIFGAVELSGFAVLLYLLGRKFGISPLYQLAFVLETQIRTVQGHLLLWSVFILHMPLMHYGKFLFFALKLL
ncbi:unnamed protein product [Phytophthora lilii]|uniref:Unnamed protein product n=1 Tax=Phytophthora lilii TaxID=2077276 RepID=A0A9W6TS19_9STRA|nr:unnamed protein product [Phytophthora lilii]